MELIKSVYDNQIDILKAITRLHLHGASIQYDVTYSTGQFYKSGDIAQPDFKYDIEPQIEGVEEFDCRELPTDSESVNSIIFDPPFLRKTGKGSILKERFGTYPTMQLLWDMYEDSIVEFARIMKSGGILIVKMQNTVMSGRQYWSVDWINNWADFYGFKKMDEFILVAKHRMPQHNLKIQRHARKYHCYFLVYKRNKR